MKLAGQLLDKGDRLLDLFAGRVAEKVTTAFTSPEALAVIARAARSVAKDYLQEQAEARGEPYGPYGCTHSEKTRGDGVTRCYVCNPELVRS